MIEYSVRDVINNWKSWDWDTSNYPLRKEEADVIVEALPKDKEKKEEDE